MRPLTIGSLFSGIGGLELGLERAGLGPVVWQVEQDDYATRILERHWPSATRFRDVRDVGAHSLAPVDLICGGFPCQDISTQGTRAGIESGSRSGLWVEFARIIRELRPRFVLVENVAALLERGMERVLADLAALGMDAEWRVLSAGDFGAPHRRERVFILAYVAGVGREAHRRILDGDVAEGICASAWDVEFARGASGRVRALPRGGVRGMDDGLPIGMDDARCLGNAVVPQVAQFIGRRILTCA